MFRFLKQTTEKVAARHLDSKCCNGDMLGPVPSDLSLSSPENTHPLPGLACRARAARDLGLWLARGPLSCRQSSRPQSAEGDKDTLVSVRTYIGATVKYQAYNPHFNTRLLSLDIPDKGLRTPCRRPRFPGEKESVFPGSWPGSNFKGHSDGEWWSRESGGSGASARG